MPDIKGGKTPKTPIVAADYSSVDPAPVTLQKSNASGLAITVTPTAQTGAGNTVTLTATDAANGRVLGTLVITNQVAGTLKLTLPDSVHRVTLTPVGSGTRTTLTYAISTTWLDLNYAPAVAFDGTAYVNSDKHNS